MPNKSSWKEVLIIIIILLFLLSLCGLTVLGVFNLIKWIVGVI